jgi:nucleobase:cation symporter-1, NCS1 family
VSRTQRMQLEEDQALAETFPLTSADRSWSFLDVLSVKSGLAIATWAFLFGGATAQLVGFWDGIFAMFFGETIGVILLVIAMVLPSSKWGTEFFVHQRSVYGTLGVMAFVLLFVAALIFAWASILATMIGKAAVEILGASGVEFSGGGGALRSGLSLAVLAIAWSVLLLGSRGVRLLNRFAAPALLILTAWLLIAIFLKIPFATLVAAAPLDAGPDRAMNIMLAVELHIAGGLSWGSLAANLGRYARTQRSVTWGSLIAYVVVFNLAATVGLASALTLSSADPVTWMIPIVGPVAGAFLLVLLALANLSSLVSSVQGNCQTLIQHLGARLQGLGWTRFTLLVTLGAAAMSVVASDALYDRFFVFIAYSQAVLAALTGIAFADRVVLRANRVNVRALYADGAGTPYHFWGRINPVAFVSLLVGVVVYLLLFDPIGMTGNALFLHLSATVPAFAAAFGSHIVLTRLILIPAGKGGYR